MTSPTWPLCLIQTHLGARKVDSLFFERSPGQQPRSELPAKNIQKVEGSEELKQGEERVRIIRALPNPDPGASWSPSAQNDAVQIADAALQTGDADACQVVAAF